MSSAQRRASPGRRLGARRGCGRPPRGSDSSGDAAHPGDVGATEAAPSIRRPRWAPSTRRPPPASGASGGGDGVGAAAAAAAAARIPGRSSPIGKKSPRNSKLRARLEKSERVVGSAPGEEANGASPSCEKRPRPARAAQRAAHRRAAQLQWLVERQGRPAGARKRPCAKSLGGGC